MSRSFQRGCNSEALNRGVSEGTIDRNDRWRKEARAGSKKGEIKNVRSLHRCGRSVKELSKLFSDFVDHGMCQPVRLSSTGYKIKTITDTEGVMNLKLTLEINPHGSRYSRCLSGHIC